MTRLGAGLQVPSVRSVDVKDGIGDATADHILIFYKVAKGALLSRGGNAAALANHLQRELALSLALIRRCPPVTESQPLAMIGEEARVLTREKADLNPSGPPGYNGSILPNTACSMVTYFCDRSPWVIGRSKLAWPTPQERRGTDWLVWA